MVQGSKHGGADIFRDSPDRPCSPPALIKWVPGIVLGVKRPGCGVNHPPTSSAEVKEGVNLYLYSPLGLCGLSKGELFLFTATVLLQTVDLENCKLYHTKPKKNHTK